MPNQNGALILQTLDEMQEPATITKIATHIANSVGVHPKELRDSVKQTLDGGVRYGYIQKQNQKYYSAPLDEINQSAGMESPADELEDRDGRRRRRRRSTSSNRRSASGQRRRRRRSRSGGR